MPPEEDDQTTDVTTEVGGESQGQQQGGENPAWADIRSELDDISYSRIAPKLKEWDSGVQQRFDAYAEQYRWANDIAKAGYQPEQVVQALQAAELLQSQPEVVYQKLQEFLAANGRLPSTQELAEEVDNDSEQNEDPRIAALAEQQQAVQEFLIRQENERIQQRADADLSSEIKALQTAHPEFDDQDVREILSRAAFQAQMFAAQGNPKVPTLEEAAQDYATMRNRILSAQRPGDSAPRLLPTSGGVPSSGVTSKTLGALSKQQTEDMLAEIIRRDNAIS